MTKAAPPIKQITALEAFFNKTLPFDARKDFMNEIIQNCGISVPTFYIRLKKPHLYSPVEQQFISELAKKPINELFN